MTSHDNKGEFSKALGDPLYVRIREALYNTSGSMALNGGEHQHDASVLPAEDLVESKDGGVNDAFKEDINNQYANGAMPMATNTKVLDSSKTFGEIVEVDCEGFVQSEEDEEEVTDIPKKEVDASVLNGKRNVYISSEVEQALETLDKAISMVRKQQLHSRVASSSVVNKESSHKKNDDRVDSYSSKLIQPSSKTEVSVEVPDEDTPEDTSQIPRTNSSIQNSR